MWTYWEPFLAVDTVTTPFYSPFLGMPTGGSLIDELGGKNATADSVNIANESTYAQAHAYPLPILNWLLCNRWDYPFWLTEFDPQWQFDELSMFIHPEAVLYANPVMQMACMADATSTNVGFPIDAMPWCIGSGGSSYPMTGHVDNDNIVQANNTAAARLIYKLNRILLICDHALNPCGCLPTPVWVKSNYKMHVVRPGVRGPAWPMGVNAAYYNAGLNAPFVGGGLGPNDEFLWTVYRRQFCCTCCD
nr:TraU family protein [Desulfogranum marinum]